ncbi:MAG: hypothetical protein LBG58_00150 [Planctomycetaceae bacterium]|nr:hypothetical protein [Planctomycetaceae bacterium]
MRLFCPFNWINRKKITTHIPGELFPSLARMPTMHHRESFPACVIYRIIVLLELTPKIDITQKNRTTPYLATGLLRLDKI